MFGRRRKESQSAGPVPVDVPIRDESIRLGQFLKLANLVDSGAEAKPVIADGLVKVNGEVDTRRGRQLHVGDVVELQGQAARVAHGDVPDNLPW
ncbi:MULTISPECIES: RNA-binding S4 domain-containing protein [unclassified Nocardioides]|uniref:RNA-binding S4 domain-containing protein n=1 Tax=unclassified Nocardioides TaxID=2615069 RepID=UPI00115182B6|nr:MULTISPECIES: RNA-binding S4 domain-containing protein [unclassified Nocardioides]WGY00183.1 RNA-binding S4 domain-containing protein [Nocardioides sp. QY071]